MIAGNMDALASSMKVGYADDGDKEKARKQKAAMKRRHKKHEAEMPMMKKG